MTIWITEEEKGDFSFDIYDIAEQVMKETLKSEGFTTDTEVSVLLTDDTAIQTLNNEFRAINKVTDVLSFPMLDFVEPCIPHEASQSEAISMETGCINLGDIVISVPQLFRQAHEYGHSPMREYAFLLTHSLLHLLGYDHIDDAERIVMEQKQHAILAHLNITR